MIKVIFLDFDGVINAQTSKWETVEVKDFIGGCPHDPQLVANLNLLLDNTDAKLVISSTWRMGTEISVLQDICNTLGIRGEVIGKTCVLGKYSVRGNEIAAYIEDNKEQLGYQYYWDFDRNYIIIDDDSDMLYPQRHNFVHINSEVGFSEEDAKKGLELLNREYIEKDLP